MNQPQINAGLHRLVKRIRLIRKTGFAAKVGFGGSLLHQAGEFCINS
jgi:hypothetical protein